MDNFSSAGSSEQNEVHEDKTSLNEIGDGNNCHEEADTIAKFFADTGITDLTEDSPPEKIITAVQKFKAVSANRGAIWIGIARSELVKKLKAVGVNSPANVVSENFRPLKKNRSDAQGQSLMLENPEPWPEEVDGAELLDAIVTTTKRYLVLPKSADTALSLWNVFAWAHDAFPISPLLDFRSPTKRCGKSTGLKVLKRLVPKPLIASNISTAALFRGIEAYRPTLLVDEVDTFLNRDPETNGLLNAGHERDVAFALRCEGENNVPKQFSVWCPKIISGIGRRKDTLEDRSIPICMKRKGPGEEVDRLPINDGDEFVTLRRKAARWAEDHIEELREANPEFPSGLNDRAKDNWMPLLAIADLCGGQWPQRAREAALILSGEDNQDDETFGVQLLSDIRDLFQNERIDRIASEELVKYLVEMEDRDWPEMGKNKKPITKIGIARLLKPFGVRPKTIRLETGSTPKGYNGSRRHFHFICPIPTFKPPQPPQR